MKQLRMGDSWRWPKIIAPVNPNVIIEIGCYRGEGAARLLAEFPEATVVMIDPWCESPPKSTYRKTNDGCAKLTQEEHNANFDAAMLATDFAKDRRVVIRLPSDEAAQSIQYSTVDVVIVDGDHSYEAVKLDCENYWQLLRDGGMLCLHDYGHRRFGVSKAAEEFAVSKGLTLNVEGSCAWLVKNA